MIIPDWKLIDTAPLDESFLAGREGGYRYMGSIIGGEFYNSSGTKPPIPPTHWTPLLPDPY